MIPLLHTPLSQLAFLIALFSLFQTKRLVVSQLRVASQLRAVLSFSVAQLRVASVAWRRWGKCKDGLEKQKKK